MAQDKKTETAKTNPEVTLQVMAHLERNPKDSQRTIASELNISLGSVNYCLKALIDKGFVKAENFRKSPNKFGYSYLLTPSGISEKASLTVAFLKRKQMEYNRLEQEIAALRAEVAKLDSEGDAP